MSTINYTLVLLLASHAFAQNAVSYSDYSIGDSKQSILRLLDKKNIAYNEWLDSESHIRIGLKDAKIIDIKPYKHEYRTWAGEDLKFSTYYRFTRIEFKDMNDDVDLDFDFNDRLMRISVFISTLKAAPLRDSFMNKYGSSVATPEATAFEFVEVYHENGVDIEFRWKPNGYAKSVDYIHRGLLEAHWSKEFYRLKGIYENEMQEQTKSTKKF